MGTDGGYGGQQNPAGGYTPLQSPDGGYVGQQAPPQNYASPAPAPAPSGGVSWIGNGVNQQPSYYPGNNKGNADLGWSLMQKDTRIKSVRIEIEPGQVTNAQRWIGEAFAAGYSVIATYHKSTVLGSDVDKELIDAASWWTTNYAQLSQKQRLIINIMNEWGSSAITPAQYAKAYNGAIQTIRGFYEDRLIVDLPGYGQAAQIACEAVKPSNAFRITDTNIVLSAHIYADAYNPTHASQNGKMLRTDLDQLAATGLACMVGEFGESLNKNTYTDWKDLVLYAKTLGWPIMGWCWNGDGNSTTGKGGQDMNMVGPAAPYDPKLYPYYVEWTPGTPAIYDPTPYYNTIAGLL